MGWCGLPSGAPAQVGAALGAAAAGYLLWQLCKARCLGSACAGHGCGIYLGVWVYPACNPCGHACPPRRSCASWRSSSGRTACWPRSATCPSSLTSSTRSTARRAASPPRSRSAWASPTAGPWAACSASKLGPASTCAPPPGASHVGPSRQARAALRRGAAARCCKSATRGWSPRCWTGATTRTRWTSPPASRTTSTRASTRRAPGPRTARQPAVRAPAPVPVSGGPPASSTKTTTKVGGAR